MEADSVTAAAEWDVVPTGRGHEGLRTLAADGFSGGVTDGTAWAMLTNGRVVGVVGGSIESFADVDLTAHRAPDPALPLLLAMRERSDGPRAQYYTEETPLSEVDATLRGAGFTGYVELSENVLSGDYYVVYYGGDRLPVAFIGGSRRLETGDEAFERADDEVGIYDVYDVDVSVVDVPGASPDPATGDGAVGGPGTAVPDDPSGPDDEPDAGGVAVPAERDETTSGGTTGQQRRRGDPTAAGADGAVTETAADEQATPDREAGSADGARSDGTDGRSDERVNSRGREATAGGDPSGASPAAVDDSGETDVDRSTADGTETSPSAGDAADAADDHDDLRETVERLRAERDDLRETVERLRAKRDDLRETDGTGLTPSTALSGTNLFVRYGSRADPTLERALDEGAGREAVDENLSLEVHTSFERAGAAVDGQPFDRFLRSSVTYRFVEWLVRALPYELRDADAKQPLGRLYEAVPSFDRAEIDGAVAVEGDGEVSFDVVLRSRKGAPLAVAGVFDSREPATEAMLSDLVERARPAAAAHESLGAALFVTTSYYAPDALELAEAETSGSGLFGRGAKESYVRLDRSHGFHLCLVEARDDDFYLGVPEL